MVDEGIVKEIKPFDMSAFRLFVESQTEANATISVKYLESVVDHIDNLSQTVAAAKDEVCRLAVDESVSAGAKMEAELYRNAIQAIYEADEIAFSDDQEVELVRGIAHCALAGESYDGLIEEMKRQNAEVPADGTDD